MPKQEPWPTEISLDEAKSALQIEFDSGDKFTLSAEYLRTHSQSAEVKGHAKGQEVLVWGKRDVQVSDMEAVGNYALKIIFSDGHDTGLYTWQYLFELGSNQKKNWSEYMEKLKQAGLKR